MWQWFWNFVQQAPFLAQSAHFFSAAAVVLAAFTLGMGWIFAALGFLAYTSLKELVFDPAPWGENHGKIDLLDYVVNLVGVGASILVIWIAGRI